MIKTNIGYSKPKQAPIPKINTDYKPDRPMTEESMVTERYEPTRPMSTEIMRNLKREER
jgi:hypothetical protein